MPFDWTEKFKSALAGWKQRMQQSGVDSAYAMVTASALWPLASAVQGGDVSGYVALGAALGANVGANLIASQIQKWKDEADGARQLAALPKHDPLRAHLDTVLERLEAFAAARSALPETDRQWFIQALRTELAELGNWPRFESQIVGDRNVAVNGEMQRSVIVTGDGNQVTNLGSVGSITVQSAVFLAPPSPGQTPPKELLWHFLNGVVRDTETLDLAGVDRKAASDEQQARLALAAVYTALDTVRTRDREFGKEGHSLKPLRERPEAETRESAVAFVSRSRCAALLGDPGSGKTTFVNFLALCLAGEMLGLPDINLKRLGADWTLGPLLPLRVVLRGLAAELDQPASVCPGDDLWSHLGRHLGQALSDFTPLLKQHLLTQGGLLLLDGLDEVPEALQKRARVKQAVLDFRRQFPRVRVVLTSRTYAYQRQEWRLPDFDEAVLAPFNDKQVESFVDRWYAHVAAVRPNLTATGAHGRATLLKQAIDRNSYLRELARRPLLLTLMASLHAWRGGALPEQREQLYEESVELLLDLWERPKIVLNAQGRPVLQTESADEWFKTSRDKIRQALEELAYEVHRAQPERTGAADIKEGKLAGALIKVSGPDVKLARVIEYVRDRAGLFIHRGEGVYGFPHRTLQEYLAARHLTGAGFPNRLVELVRGDVERWREVVLLAGAKVARGTPYAAWSLVSKLCPAACDSPRAQPATDTDWWLALLAGQLLIETGIGLATPADADEEQRRRQVVSWLEHLVSGGRLPPVDRARAGVELGRLGDTRRGVGLKNGLPDIDWIEIPPGPITMGNKKGETPYGDETPQFPCNLIQKPYRIGRYPVTVRQYQAFVEAKGYEIKRYWTKAGWAWRSKHEVTAPEKYDEVFQTPNHPRAGLSWYEAVAFCRWLSEQLKTEVRLPSEAEWERAARHTDGRTFPWGNEDEAPERCNMGDTGIGSTSAVGMFPNGHAVCGAADMSGNVWEWCRTKWRNNYSDYDKQVDDDLEGDDSRVLRGGAFLVDRDDVRCADRCWDDPRYRLRDVGFRVVASPFLFSEL